MRRVKLITLMSFLLLLTSNGFSQGKDSITLLSSGKIYMQYFNQFDDLIDFSLNANEKKTVFFENTISIIKSNHFQPSYFILTPNNKVQFSSNDKIIVFNTLDQVTKKVRENELNFIPELIKKTGFVEGSAKAFVRWPRQTIDQMDQDISKAYHLPLPAKNFELRDKDVEKRHKNRMIFFYEYKANNELSDNFINYTSSYLRYLYLIDKIRVFSNVTFKKEFLSVNNYTLIDSLTKNLAKEGRFDIYYFRQALKMYLFYLVVRDNKSVKNYNDLIGTILSNFNGQSKDYLLFTITKDQLSSLTEDELSFFYTNCKSDNYKNYIQNIAELNRIRNQGLISEVNLINFNGKTYSWKEMIDKHKGRLIYIDWWATWCGPCREEEPFYFALAKKYKDQEIDFVLISLDHSSNLWKSHVEAQKLQSNQEHYLLQNVKSAKILGIEHIPHYMLVDREGKIIKANSESPSSSIIENLLNNALKK